MTELEIFLDASKTQKVDKIIDFGIVPAGEVTQKEFFIHNTIKYDINVTLKLVGEGVALNNGSSITITPRTTKAVSVTLSPTLTTMQPIKAKVEINGKYVVR